MNIKNLRKIDFLLGSVLIVLLRPASILLGTILRRNHDLIIRKQLVVTKFRGGGSLLLALPAMLSLRKKYPDKKFTLITSEEVKPFAELMSVFDEFVIVSTSNFFSFLMSSVHAIRKAWRADGLINFEIHSKLATVFSCLSCARNRFGFYYETNSWQRDVITHLFFYNITSPVYINYNQVALALGATILPYREVSDFFIQQNRLEKIFTDEGHLHVVLASYCSELGKEREFAPEHWVKILKTKFDGKNPVITILGGPSDVSRSIGLERQLKEAFPDCKIINRVGQTSLRESAVIIKSADEFLSIDSGLNHIARLTGSVRITSYWGPTDPATRLAPFPNLSETVVYTKLFCSPCVHAVAIPPCKGNNICMKQYVKDDLNQYSTGGWLIISNSATPKNI
ncbi:MAG TPA: glycosyltransferase family 9 protein [Chitinophagales bacterium]|nr:glycosyltransferase family 9 protein [Chitinophagales bacterium]